MTYVNRASTPPDVEIMRMAGFLIGEHAENAWAEACRRAVHFATAEDNAKAEMWRRVANAVSNYQRAQKASHPCARD